MPGPEVQQKSKTSWRGKLHKPMLPFQRRTVWRSGWGHGMMLLPTLLEVDTMIRKIPT